MWCCVGAIYGVKKGATVRFRLLLFRRRNEDTSVSQNCGETFSRSVLHDDSGNEVSSSKHIRLLHKGSLREFHSGFVQDFVWRHFTLSELHGNFLSLSVSHEDIGNVVSSLEFIHCCQKGATARFRHLLIKRKTLHCPRIACELPLLLSLA